MKKFNQRKIKEQRQILNKIINHNKRQVNQEQKTVYVDKTENIYIKNCFLFYCFIIAF